MISVTNPLKILFWVFRSMEVKSIDTVGLCSLTDISNVIMQVTWVINIIVRLKFPSKTIDLFVLMKNATYVFAVFFPLIFQEKNRDIFCGLDIFLFKFCQVVEWSRYIEANKLYSYALKKKWYRVIKCFQANLNFVDNVV